jgi:hypothetical protein
MVTPVVERVTQLRWTLTQRKMIVARMSWVTRLASPRPCDGKNGTCKHRAYWKFRALKKSWAEDGFYCWPHLIYHGIYADMDEEERTNKWLSKRGYI